jgi:hypothetical protein
VGYGEPFQLFLLKNVKIEYVIEFDRAVFPDAEVNTAVTILEKDSDEGSRRRNLVKFVRVKRRLDIEELRKRIQGASASFEDEALRVNVVQQERLTSGKWNIYLRAPLVYSKIISNPKVKPLESIAEVFRGPTTGFNDYFILSKEQVQEWQIERRFLRPCISSPKRIRGLAVRRGDVDDYFFMVHEQKHQLKATNALKYIEHGEKLEIEVSRGSKRGARKLPELETVKNRQPWYSLAEPKIAAIIFQYMIDVRGQVLWNLANAHASDVFHYVVTSEIDDVLPMLGFLNSSLAALSIELYGRSYGGGILKVQAYELRELPVIDPSFLSEHERDEISQAFKSLVDAVDSRASVEDEFEKARSKAKGAKGLFEDEAKEKLDKAIQVEEQARRRLDESFYEILGLTVEERKQVEDGLRELQELRRLRTVA